MGTPSSEITTLACNESVKAAENGEESPTYRLTSPWDNGLFVEIHDPLTDADDLKN